MARILPLTTRFFSFFPKFMPKGPHVFFTEAQNLYTYVSMLYLYVHELS